MSAAFPEWFHGRLITRLLRVDGSWNGNALQILPASLSRVAIRISIADTQADATNYAVGLADASTEASVLPAHALDGTLNLVTGAITMPTAQVEIDGTDTHAITGSISGQTTVATPRLIVGPSSADVSSRTGQCYAIPRESPQEWDWIGHGDIVCQAWWGFGVRLQSEPTATVSETILIRGTLAEYAEYVRRRTA